MHNEGYVTLDIHNKVGIVTFFHPKSNSLPSRILKLLAETITSASENSEVNVIVIKSDGEKAFCAGASFDELVQINDFQVGKEFFLGFARVINAIRKSPKFVVARVQGKAVGGGVGIAAAADYSLAYKDASIKLSEFALGIGPFVVGPAVERKIGNTAFAQISTDVEWYNSTWALNKGLYANVFYTIDDLNDAVTALASKLGALSPDATQELKKIFWHGTDDWDILLESRAEISGRLVLSDFTKNYINEFKSK